MKEPVHDIRGTESPDDRKRRLARERQRRHREKIRARLRAESEDTPANQDNVISTLARTSQFQQQPRKRTDDDTVAPERDALQRKSFSQRDPYIDPPDLHSTLERTTNLTPKNSTRVGKVSSLHVQKPGTERPTGLLRRSERPFVTKPSLRGDKQDREDKRLDVNNQRQSSTPPKPQDRQQHLHQQHHRRQHPNQPQRHHQPESLQQQQRQPQERTPEIRHRPTDNEHATHVPLLDQQREHPSREQHQSDLDKKGQREQHQRPPQRHDYGRHELLHQQPPFQSNSHGYSGGMHQQHTPHPQHQHETGFGFPQTDVGVGQQSYVTDPHRQYVPDAGMQLGVTTRTYPRFGMRTRSSMSHAASGFASVPGAGQGLQSNMGAGAPGTVNVGVHGGLTLNRDTGMPKYRPGTNNAVTGVQHAASPLGDGRDAGAAVDPYAQAQVESAEERKRRLARERQRRRRKRLKQDSGEPTKVEGDNLHRTQHDAARDALAGPASVTNAPMDIPMHVRGTESNMQPQVSSAMHGGLPTFESPNLASSHPLTSVHGLQVSGVGGGQDDLGGAASARGGFSTHTLGVPGTGTGPAAGSGVLAHSGVGELHRLHSHGDEKLGRAQYPDEDSETRKRRLARDRQRRRRERIKSRKLGDMTGASVHDLKGTPTGNAKLGDGVDARATSDSERRVVASEGIGEPDRLPLGPTGSSVFGTRADVAQSLTFGDQGRNMRAASVPDGTVSGMPIGYSNSGMLNLPNVPVNSVSLQLQNMVHWSQAFESEGSAKFAVDSAVATFQRQLPSNNPSARSYIIQQSIITLLGTEEAGRDLLNGPMIPSLRTDAVMRL